MTLTGPRPVCPDCRVPRRLHKLRRRRLQVVGHPAIELRIPRYICRAHRTAEHVPREVERLWWGKSPYGWDVLFVVGWLRWVHQEPVEEVRRLLATMGVPLSAGSVSALSMEFLVRFRLLHETVLADRLRAAMARRPATIVEVDGLLPGIGQPVVLIVREALVGAVLLATEIQSESKEECQRVAEQYRERLGTPDRLLRDDGTGIRDGFGAVFPGVLQGLDHTHFLRDTGDALVREDYEALRHAVAGEEFVASLKAFRKGLETGTDPATDILRSQVEAILVSGRSGGRELPFPMPVLRMIRMAQGVREQLGVMVRVCGRQNRADERVLELDQILRRMLETCVTTWAGKSVAYGEARIRRLCGWYDGLRVVLRRARTGDEGATRYTDEELAAVGRALDAWLERVEREGRELGTTYEERARKLTARVRAKRGELLVPNIRRGDVVIPVPRTTAVVEVGNRRVRKEARQRTGREFVGEDVLGRGVELVYGQNLTNRWYVDEVLGGIGNLVELLRTVDGSVVRERQGAMPERRQEVRGGWERGMQLLGAARGELEVWAAGLGADLPATDS